MSPTEWRAFEAFLQGQRGRVSQRWAAAVRRVRQARREEEDAGTGLGLNVAVRVPRLVSQHELDLEYYRSSRR